MLALMQDSRLSGHIPVCTATPNDGPRAFREKGITYFRVLQISSGTNAVYTELATGGVAVYVVIRGELRRCFANELYASASADIVKEVEEEAYKALLRP